MHIADRSTESFHAAEILLIPQTSNFAVSLTLKTRTVTGCDLLTPPPASALTETGNKKKIYVQNFALQNFNMWSMYVQSFNTFEAKL